MAGVRRLVQLGLLAATLSAGIGTGHAQSAFKPATPPARLRLYVFDCRLINVNRAGTERYNVTPEEVGETRFVVPCFLIAHPRGTLMWDRPADITYFAFSHAHSDDVANANLFAASTWLARPAERASMWQEGNTRVNRTFFDRIEKSKSIALDRDEYDVLGDGSAVIKSAPGHSPGHQVLVLNLARTGRVMLAGDLYHYPQERTLKRPPPATEFSVDQSAASRAMIETYLARTKTAIWIEHDFAANAKLGKSPAYCE